MPCSQTRSGPHRSRRVISRLLAAAAVVAGLAPLSAPPAGAVDAGIITTIVSRSVSGVSLAGPRTAAVDNRGDIYFTDTEHHKIRRLDTNGVVTDIAGTGRAGGSGDGGPALQATLDTPHGVAVDNRGHVLIADSPNHRIRSVDLASGIITTIVGTGVPGFSGDGGPATEARIARPRFLIVAPDGSLIIADTENRRVRKVTPDGRITTIAGTGSTGYSGDGGPATSAKLDDPRGLALDAAGNLYISNAEGSPVPSVRRVDPAGIITTVAGGKPAGFSGDGGPAASARLNEPRSLAISGQTLYIADSLNHRIRRVNLSTGIIDTVAGTGTAGYGGDGGVAVRARIAEPRGVAVTAGGDVIIADTGNNRLRLVGVPPGSTNPGPPPVVAELDGSVQDRAGRPVDGALVDVVDGTGEFVTRVRSTSDGRFTVGLDDGRYQLLARSPLGCSPLGSDPVAVSAAGGSASPPNGTFTLSRFTETPDDAPTDTAKVAADPDGTTSARLDTAIGDVKLTFRGLTKGGTVASRCQPDIGGLPAGLHLIDNPLELSSADVAFKTVEVCLPYSPPHVAGLDESILELVQLPDGEVITGSRFSGKLCGTTDRLTEVAIASATPIPRHEAPPAGGPAAIRGYRLVATDGGLFAFGDAPFFGSTGNIRLNQPIVGGSATPTGQGYWLVASDGGIFAFGDARFHGSTGNIRLNKPIVGMTPSPSGEGYWLVASDGGIFAFGDARFFGSTGNVRLARPIVGMAATPAGAGYWLVASDGGIFSFGDAQFFGSGASTRRSFVAMAPTPGGHGYWLATQDGGVLPFGDAGSFGAADGAPLNRPIAGLAPTPTGKGYWLTASDGGIFAFGDAQFLGSTGAIRLNQPIVGLVD